MAGIQSYEHLVQECDGYSAKIQQLKQQCEERKAENQRLKQNLQSVLQGRHQLEAEAQTIRHETSKLTQAVECETKKIRHLSTVLEQGKQAQKKEQDEFDALTQNLQQQREEYAAQLERASDELQAKLHEKRQVVQNLATLREEVNSLEMQVQGMVADSGSAAITRRAELEEETQKLTDMLREVMQKIEEHNAKKAAARKEAENKEEEQKSTTTSEGDKEEDSGRAGAAEGSESTVPVSPEELAALQQEVTQMRAVADEKRQEVHMAKQEMTSMIRDALPGIAAFQTQLPELRNELSNMVCRNCKMQISASLAGCEPMFDIVAQLRACLADYQTTGTTSATAEVQQH